MRKKLIAGAAATAAAALGLAGVGFYAFSHLVAAALAPATMSAFAVVRILIGA